MNVLRLLQNDSKAQKGFTLIEILIALAITGILVLVLSSIISQVITVNGLNTRIVTAQRQVQQVGFYLSKDCQQARIITVGNNPTGTGFPVVCSSVDLDGKSRVVTYSLSNSGVVSRSETLNGAAVSTLVIATNINTASANTVFSFVSTGIYNLKITATIAGKITASETRQYQILQRTN